MSGSTLHLLPRCDLSDPHILDQLAGEPLEAGNADEILRTAREWQSAWQATGQAGVPLIVAAAGDLLIGCRAAGEIVECFRRS